MTPPPVHSKIYHLVHVDRLPSIIGDGHLWCDAKMVARADTGTAIGMPTIKQRRSAKGLTSHRGLHVGARDWQQHKEGKQAEFLVEHSLSWNLVRRVGVHSRPALERPADAMREADHQPKVEILRNWYYGTGGSSP